MEKGTSENFQILWQNRGSSLQEHSSRGYNETEEVRLHHQTAASEQAINQRLCTLQGRGVGHQCR